MEHITPYEELDDHVFDDCSCKPRIIYDKISGELIAIHYPFDPDLEMIGDEDALDLIHESPS